MPSVRIPAAASKARRNILAHLESALDELDELPRLDDARYFATHTLFEALSDQRQQIIDELCSRVAPRPPADRPLRVLGVGCGAGEVDAGLARALAARAEEVDYVGVDPNPTQCAAFQRSFDEADLPGVRLQVEASTFDDFEPANRFDVVHFVHSLYYMHDPVEALARARRLLAPGGELIVVHAPCEDLNQLAVRFYDKTYERPTHFADDYAALLGSRGWGFERRRLDARVDVTAFTEDEPEVGTALRDFIVQVDGRRLPRPVQGLIERYLRLIATEDEERHVIAHPVDVFFISG